MTPIYPRAIRQGDTIAFVAPAGVPDMERVKLRAIVWKRSVITSSYTAIFHVGEGIWPGTINCEPTS